MCTTRYLPGYMSSFNRTFMELKSRKGQSEISTSLSFNRTFMELKWEISYHKRFRKLVLIVPLWN